MQFSTCQNSKYFRFYGTLNFNFLFLLITVSSPDLQQFFNEAISMNLAMQLPKKIPQGGFMRKTENKCRSIFLDFEFSWTSLFFDVCVLVYTENLNLKSS